MHEHGLIHVYTGDGKGKTTAALGLAWRALGRGFRVLIVQFLKEPDTSGEHLAAHFFAPLLTIKSKGRKGFIFERGLDPEDISLAVEALEEAKTSMRAGDYDLVILDEINVAVHLGLVSLTDLLDFIDSKPDKVELVLTGRYASAEVIDRADLVVEMKNVKHYFDQGIMARMGIEY